MVTRTIRTKKWHVRYVEVGGKEIAETTVFLPANSRSVRREVGGELPFGSIVVSIEDAGVIEKKYSMPEQTFIANATVVKKVDEEEEYLDEEEENN